jgi:hypothetical protein
MASLDSAPQSITVDEARQVAQAKLKGHIWDYCVTGADAETNVRRNQEIYAKYVLALKASKTRLTLS